MSKTPVAAVETSLRILHRLERNAPRGVTELAEQLDRPKATVYYHLKTLEEHGYVVQTKEGYDLGLRVLELGGRVRARHPLTAIVGPNLKRLAAEANEIAIFVVEDREAAVILDLERPTELTTRVDVFVGMHLPLHGSAAGKALLSRLSDDQLESVLDTLDFTQFTPDTIRSRSQLRDHLSSIRDDGQAYERGEYDPDVNGVASPIVDVAGSAIGAIGIIGPASRLYSDRFTHELPHLVERFAERIQDELRDIDRDVLR